MSSDHPHRFASQPTVIIDRSKLPPVASLTLEEIADAERARRDAQDEIGTLVACKWCTGCGMVTPEKAAYWRARYPELAADEPIPPSRPEGA